MNISQQLEKASGQLKDLSHRASDAEANVKAAQRKGQAELKQQVDAAQESAKDVATKLKSSADASKHEASQHWSDIQKSWKEHIAKVHHDADEAKANLDEKRAERHAERAEDDAVDAIAFVFAALEEAEYQVLDAALARIEADSAAAR